MMGVKSESRVKTKAIAKRGIKTEKDGNFQFENQNIKFEVDSELADAEKGQKRKIKIQKNLETKRRKLSKTLDTENNTEPLWKEDVFSQESSVHSKIQKRNIKNEGSNFGNKIFLSKTEPKCEPLWEDYELLSERTLIEADIAKSIIHLFEEGNTIPFIARYRRNVTGNMTPEGLRTIKDDYDEICSLKLKLRSVITTIAKSEKLNDVLQKSILSVRTIEELDHIYAPYKPESKRSLSERAKALGLEQAALNILNNARRENLEFYVVPNKEGVRKIEDVEKGIIHIISAIISSDTELLSFLRELRSSMYCMIETKKSVTKTDKVKKDKNDKLVDESKYRNYFDYRISSNNIQPHQILAINRGEKQKVLSVKIVIPEFIFNKFTYFCNNKWIRIGVFDMQRNKLLTDAIKDSYNRLVQPLLIREERSKLKLVAEKAACETFSKNLKQLLLASPMKGKLILGIDPGFSNGCKLALISETGTLIDHRVIHPHNKGSGKAVDTLRGMLLENSCSLIALGNGTACRETENWLTGLIHGNEFKPLQVTYTIVNEAGASIYSCGKEAKKEFPDLDVNVISAVSLARRIQEPLSELVKVEPQHLGVGMYQHDMKRKQLDEALNDVVSECVSFVGVDLNTASQCLLRRIAGLTDKRAEQIIEYREKNGPFKYRKQLTEIKGIGPKIFEQCAGFLRVGPINASEEPHFYKESKTSKLDRTYIHPEAYGATKKLLKKFKLNVNDVGTDEFINSIKAKYNESNFDELVKISDSNEATVKLILDTLRKPLNHDLRYEHSIIPLFKKGLTNIYDLKVGSVLSGRVCNVTSFGCFVDIGVGNDGLIHNSKMKGASLQIGDRVEVEVMDLEIDRKRISLRMIKIT